MKRIMIVALLLVATTLFANGGPTVTTVILVRHGEKAGPTGDVPLSPAGATRADELARVLASVKLDAVYSTAVERTRKTAAPAAAKQGLTVVELDTQKVPYVETIARIIRDKHEGGTVLVVGHSDTTAEVIRALGGTASDIEDSTYDNLFIVTLIDGKAAKVLPLRYGADKR